MVVAVLLLAHPLVPGENATALPLIAVIAATVESEYPTILLLFLCYNRRKLLMFDLLRQIMASSARNVN